MRLIARMVFLVAACLATRGLADVPMALPAPQAQTQSPPLSIWRLGDSGDAEHLQSGLACPAQFRSYTRVDLHVYDAFGLDVSCNYTAPGVILTVYVTRRSGAADIDGAVAEARREFVTGRADWHPRPISDTRSIDGAVAWHVLLYGDDQGRDGIWIADLHGWTLEYRITNTVAVDSQAQADIAAMTQMVVGSAGARLGLCARSPPPARTGVAITKADGASGLMSAVIASAGAASGHGDTQIKVVTMCAEQPIRGDNVNLLLWRGVFDDGTDAGTDELTAMTVTAPPTLAVESDPASNLIEQEAGRPPKWTASIGDTDQVRLYGYFTARPSPEALSALFQDILAGKAHPVSAYNLKSKTITIGLPSGK